MSRATEALELAKQIVKKEDELNALKKEFTSMFPDSPHEASLPSLLCQSDTGSQLLPIGKRKHTIRDKVIEILNSQPLRPWTVPEIAERMGNGTKPESISSIASRMAIENSPSIWKVSRGRWASTHWKGDKMIP